MNKFSLDGSIPLVMPMNAGEGKEKGRHPSALPPPWLSLYLSQIRFLDCLRERENRKCMSQTGTGFGSVFGWLCAG